MRAGAECAARRPADPGCPRGSTLVAHWERLRNVQIEVYSRGMSVATGAVGSSAPIGAGRTVGDADAGRVGLRERKKDATRRALAEAAMTSPWHAATRR